MFTRCLLRRSASLVTSFNAVAQPLRTQSLTCKTTMFVRPVSCSSCMFQEMESEDALEDGKKAKYTTDPKKEGLRGYKPRSVDFQTSIRYMESEAYQDVYGDDPVWKTYRRNQKGSTYRKPKRTCIRSGVLGTSSPCPICRDDYLVLDYRNLRLLKQFVQESNHEPLSEQKTHICLAQQKKLRLEVAKAQDLGLLRSQTEARLYNYDYYKSLCPDLEDSEITTGDRTKNDDQSSSKQTGN
ncbi:Ribosomal protein S18 [Mactra antiquata]